MPKKSKNPILRKEWPRIIDYRDTESKCVMLDARPHGKREYFKSIGEARTRADQLEAERENRGTEALSFSTKDRVMAVECSAKLQPFGKTLRDATEHYVSWLTSEEKKRQSLLVSECVDRFIESRRTDMERSELDKKSFYETRDRAKQVKEALGAFHIGEIDVERVKTYLDSFPVAPRTRNNIRLRMSKFFNFCKEKKWIERNPCEEVRIKVKRADTQILSVAEAKHLLTKAQQSEFREAAVPYTALCLFAGLRPGEAEQLDWQQVHFPTNAIEVLHHTSKGRETRFVEMEKTLVRCLKPYAKKEGRVVGSNFRKKWEAVKRSAGYDPANKKSRWVQDIMRHSYASYWLAVQHNRARLAELMGNSVDVIRAHYRRPILEADARRFWSILPTP